jgi:hypothetical protein
MNTHEVQPRNSCNGSILRGTVGNEAGYRLTPRWTVKRGLIGPKTGFSCHLTTAGLCKTGGGALKN